MFEGLDSETLQLALSDRSKTLEYVKKNVEQEQSEKVNDTEYIDALVNEMQKLTKIIYLRKNVICPTNKKRK